MASLMRMFRKSVKRSLNAVRSVGKATRRTVKRVRKTIRLRSRNRNRN